MVRQGGKNLPDLVFRTCLQSLLAAVAVQMDYPSFVLAGSGRWAAAAAAAEACLSSVLAARAHLSFVLEG